MTIDEMKERKREKGYSYAQLSELSGVPVPTILKIFNGQTKSPRYATLSALEKALKAAPQDSRLKENAINYSAASPKFSYLPDDGVVYPRQGSYTIEDYYALPEDVRAELIDGVIYNMTAPVPIHQLLAQEAFLQFQLFIRSKNGRCLPFLSPIDVQLNQDNRTMVQPDLIILCNIDLMTKKNIFGAPDFVMEVISPSTGRKDKIKKYSKYAEAGVREYWIVDPYRRTVTVNYFEEENFNPVIYPIDADIPVRIYSNELVINFSAILQWLPEEN